jgi:hypothetical protein
MLDDLHEEIKVIQVVHAKSSQVVGGPPSILRRAAPIP